MIVVELKTPAAVPLLRYSTSKRILALPTSLLNARRCAVQPKMKGDETTATGS